MAKFNDAQRRKMADILRKLARDMSSANFDYEPGEVKYLLRRAADMVKPVGVKPTGKV